MSYSVRKKIILALSLAVASAACAGVSSAGDLDPYVGLSLVSHGFSMGGTGKAADINSSVPSFQLSAGYPLGRLMLSSAFMHGSGQSINGTMNQYDISLSVPMSTGHGVSVSPLITVGRMDVNSNDSRSVKSNYVLAGVGGMYQVTSRISFTGSIMGGRNANPWVAGLPPSTSGLAYRSDLGVSFSVADHLDLGLMYQYTRFPMGDGLNAVMGNYSTSVSYHF